MWTTDVTLVGSWVGQESGHRGWPAPSSQCRPLLGPPPPPTTVYRVRPSSSPANPVPTRYVCVAYEARVHSFMGISHGTPEGFTKCAGLTGALVHPRGPFHTTVRILLFHEFLSSPSVPDPWSDQSLWKFVGDRGAAYTMGWEFHFRSRLTGWRPGYALALPFCFGPPQPFCCHPIIRSKRSPAPFSPRLVSLSQPKT